MKILKSPQNSGHPISLTQNSLFFFHVKTRPFVFPYQVLHLQPRVDLGAMAMKGVLCIPQSFSITGTFPSDCLVSYLGNSLGGGVSYLSVEKQSEYSTAPVDWASLWDGEYVTVQAFFLGAAPSIW